MDVSESVVNSQFFPQSQDMLGQCFVPLGHAGCFFVSPN